MSAHDVGKEEASAAVLMHWRKVAAAARAANLPELLATAEEHIALRESAVATSKSKSPPKTDE